MMEQEYSKEYFEKFLFPDFEKGELYWKEDALSRKMAGRRAGYISNQGSRNVRIKGKSFREHIIIWTLYYGTPPKTNLTHINGNLFDNRISNLKYFTWYNSRGEGRDILEDLKTLFEYDPISGKISRAEGSLETSKSEIWRGTRDASGYKVFKVYGKSYKAHRIIWALIHGCWPENIDHINGDRSDNRMSNLREVSMRGNANNLLRHREGLLVGAHYHLKIKRWVSGIKFNKKKVHLGCSSTMEGANSLYTFAMANLDKYTGNAKEFREYVKSHALIEK